MAKKKSRLLFLPKPEIQPKVSKFFVKHVQNPGGNKKGGRERGILYNGMGHRTRRKKKIHRWLINTAMSE